MNHRQALVLSIVLVAASTCATACAAPQPTPTPAGMFDKLGDLLDVLAVAPDGTLWVGTEAGAVSSFDGHARRTWMVEDIASE